MAVSIISYLVLLMRGGALEDVPRWKKMFAVAAVAAAIMLTLSQTLLLSARKSVCSFTALGGSAEQVEKQLDAACGPLVKLNTEKEYSYVIYLASVLFTGLLWLVVLATALKGYLWDTLRQHTARGVDTGLLLYAVFGTFGMAFLGLAFAFVGSKTGRTCHDASNDSSLSKECTVTTYNNDMKGWLSVPVIVFGALALVPVWSLFRSRQFLE